MSIELPEGFKFRRVHLHPHNSTGEDRLNATKGILQTPVVPKYVTISRIVDKERRVFGEGVAICNSKDVPSRKRGRLIADGRALAHFHLEGDNHA
jgi:hypothetical protein